MPAPYFFFQPLLDPTQAWAGLQLQAWPPGAAGGEDFSRCFAESGASALLGQIRIVLASDPAWFEQGESYQKFAREQTIFSVPAAVTEDAAALDHCRALRARGHHLALRIDSRARLTQAPATTFDYLVFDAAEAHATIPALDLINAVNAGQQLVAIGVASHDLQRWLASRQFALMSSEFVMTRDLAGQQEADTTRIKLLKLLSLIVQDADTAEIEKVFREEPKLSYNLLRLVNSVAVGAKTKISSFSQAITVLGRRQLQRWLQLLIYANQYAQGNQANPLLQLAAARGRALELMAASLPQAAQTPDFGEAAFMTGIFSLLDVLLGITMTEVLTALPLTESVALALERHEGVLGQLLDVVVAGDEGDFATASDLLARLDIAPATHAAAQISALHWASRINME